MKPAILEVYGVRNGDPCWVVPCGVSSSPILVPVAMLIWDGSAAKVLHDGVLYGLAEVFRTEEDARQRAVQSALWHQAYHRTELDKANAVLSELADSVPIVIAEEEEA